MQCFLQDQSGDLEERLSNDDSFDGTTGSGGSQATTPTMPGAFTCPQCFKCTLNNLNVFN